MKSWRKQSVDAVRQWVCSKSWGTRQDFPRRLIPIWLWISFVTWRLHCVILNMIDVCTSLMELLHCLFCLQWLWHFLLLIHRIFPGSQLAWPIGMRIRKVHWPVGPMRSSSGTCISNMQTCKTCLSKVYCGRKGVASHSTELRWPGLKGETIRYFYHYYLRSWGGILALLTGSTFTMHPKLSWTV